MATRIGKKTRKCKQCKGDICIHETAKQKECLPFGPSIAEQCMEILDKLLKDKEGTPEDILKLATHDQLFQIGMDPLCLVAAMGNVDVMRRFLDAGSNVNVRSTADASTPLMLATQNRHTEMAELLLKHGADVTAVNMEKNNSFCIAVRTGDAKLVNAIWPYRGNLDINHANSVSTEKKSGGGTSSDPWGGQYNYSHASCYTYIPSASCWKLTDIEFPVI